MHAGFRSAEAPLIYRAIQLASMAGFPLMVALTCAILARPLAGALVWIILGFCVGFFLPRFILNKAISSRQRELRWGWRRLDLMVVCVEAGWV
jgi:pilus assembly protein TadC